MSALPAQITEQQHPSGFTTVPTIRPVVPTHRPESRARVQAERRAAQRAERQSRRWWAVGACTGLAASFALTVGILDVLH